MSVKQVILIRRDLNMRRGKECAQVAHSSMMWLSARHENIDDFKIMLALMGFSVGCCLLMLVNLALGTLVGTLSGLYVLQVFWIWGCPRPLLAVHEKEWLQGTFTKVVLQVESEEQLVSLYEAANKAGLLSYMVVDSGKTEFHGNPTKTAVAIGPNNSEDIDAITGHLKLY